MNRILRIITSRWTQAAVILLWLIALHLRLGWLLYTAIGLAAIVVAGLLVRLVAGALQARRRKHEAYGSYGDTPSDKEEGNGKS